MHFFLYSLLLERRITFRWIWVEYFFQRLFSEPKRVNPSWLKRDLTLSFFLHYMSYQNALPNSFHFLFSLHLDRLHLLLFWQHDHYWRIWSWQDYSWWGAIPGSVEEGHLHFSLVLCNCHDALHRRVCSLKFAIFSLDCCLCCECYWLHVIFIIGMHAAVVLVD